MTEPTTNQSSPQVVLYRGEALSILSGIPSGTIDAIVTDPPYGLSKEPDPAEVLRHWLAGDDYKHSGGGFMGKTWDSFVPGPSVWKECLRVLKPGGHLLCFAGSRTVDLMGIAIRLGGFEIRDQLQWLYGSGFPKSMAVGRAIDKAAGKEREQGPVDPTRAARLVNQGGDYSTDSGWSAGGRRVTMDPPATPEAEEWEGWGTALKPAHEPIIMARKPFKGTVAANVLAHGTGALNIDACRIPTTDKLGGGAEKDEQSDKPEGWDRPWRNDPEAQAAHAQRIRENVEKAESLGRWPANVVLDPEAGEVLDEQSGPSTSRKGSPRRSAKAGEGWGMVATGAECSDTGGASRFFYCAKASKSERNSGLPDGMKNTHPTVKPVALMEWLVQMVTPPGGTVLDPYVGSGSTLVAAAGQGFHGVGVDRDDDGVYLPIATARILNAGGEVTRP